MMSPSRSATWATASPNVTVVPVSSRGPSTCTPSVRVLPPAVRVSPGASVTVAPRSSAYQCPGMSLNVCGAAVSQWIAVIASHPRGSRNRRSRASRQASHSPRKSLTSASSHHRWLRGLPADDVQPLARLTACATGPRRYHSTSTSPAASTSPGHVPARAGRRRAGRPGRTTRRGGGPRPRRAGRGPANHRVERAGQRRDRLGKLGGRQVDERVPRQHRRPPRAGGRTASRRRSPTSNASPGNRRRASATIAGERSIPGRRRHARRGTP